MTSLTSRENTAQSKREHEGPFFSALFTIISALICIAVGLIVGFLVLLAINSSGAWNGICTIVGNFLYFPKAVTQMKYLGLTLSKTAPLIMCALSVIYANKAGMFNIGAAGQYVIGTCAALYFALALGMPWPVCLIVAFVAGAIAGALCGALKVFCNVNEVISGILINWIILYFTNMVLSGVKAPDNPYTLILSDTNPSALLPTLGLDAVFGTPFIGLGLVIALVASVLVWARFKFTRFGFEMKSVGKNKIAARSMGMREKLLALSSITIAGGIAGLAGALLYLNGYQEWMCSQSSVPQMGFNGIAAAFLGGVNPIGAIFASFFIQNITDGGVFLDTSMYSAETSVLISGVIIYLCGFMMMIRSFLLKHRERRRRSEEEPKKIMRDKIDLAKTDSFDSSSDSNDLGAHSSSGAGETNDSSAPVFASDTSTTTQNTVDEPKPALRAAGALNACTTEKGGAF